MLYEERCVVCGVESTDNRIISCAHILNSKEACKKLRIQSWNERNFLALCGNRGDEGSCYDAFDKGKMSFMHVNGDTTLWKVIGGGPYRHGSTVGLQTNPYKRSLHTHFARCIVIKSLIIYDETAEEDIDPDDDVSVSDSMEDDEDSTLSNPSVNSIVSGHMKSSREYRSRAMVVVMSKSAGSFR